jgi:hypothetical protein
MTFGDEPVCSHALTPDMLTDMGFPVRKTFTCMGSVEVVRPGKKFEDARYDAWLAGKSRLCTKEQT